MRRAAEYRPGAVIHEHEIRHIDRQLAALDKRVARAQPGVYANFLCCFNGLLPCPQAIALLGEIRDGGILAGQLDAQRMVGRERAKRSAEQRIGTGGIDFEPLRRVAATGAA